ncbi:MAG: SDR family oxidoreductase [Planctomycetes bacterium]|nr:SDR family oxidoreductase [Planctomycetota bacterium]
MQADNTGKLILVTGVTGYVGSRLVQTLQSSGYAIRCLIRRPGTLPFCPKDRTEVVGGDLLNRTSLYPALTGVHTAFYLVHSMSNEGDFVQQDHLAAHNFISVAKETGVKRIIYLGGLGSGQDLSPHLKSRHEVGRILRDSGIPCIEFRASIIIGSGSISFEMIRALVEKLPVMVTPRWVRAEAQPVSINDVLMYLIQAIEVPLNESKIIEIGGPERFSYREIMKEYARQRGLHRFMIPVPVLTPYLSSLWLRFVTPLYVRIGRRLIESIKNATVVQDNTALDVFSVHPCGLQIAIKQALDAEENDFVNFRASKLCKESSSESKQHYNISRGARIYDIYARNLPCSAEIAFEPIRQIGGENGWYYANWLWTLRRAIDRLLGGPGFRKSTADPENLKAADIIDFWRVERYEPGRLLCLKAEMKLPGRAWLQFEACPHDAGVILYQTAVFDPLGLAGRMYWHGLYPIHRLLFSGMLKNIARKIKHPPVNNHGLKPVA